MQKGRTIVVKPASCLLECLRNNKSKGCLKTQRFRVNKKLGERKLALLKGAWTVEEQELLIKTMKYSEGKLTSEVIIAHDNQFIVLIQAGTTVLTEQERLVYHMKLRSN